LIKNTNNLKIKAITDFIAELEKLKELSFEKKKLVELHQKIQREYG